MVVRFVDECKYTDCFVKMKKLERNIFSAQGIPARQGRFAHSLGETFFSVSSVARTAYYVQPGHIHTSLQRLEDSWAG